MSSPHEKISEIFPHAPQDLVAYFDEIADESLPNLLAASDAVKETSKFWEFHPVVQALGGFILDDAGTSNHHLYLTQAPMQGTVLFLSHDGDTRVMFASLREFIAAVRLAQAQGCDLEDLHPKLSPISGNQATLSSLAQMLLDGGKKNDVVVALIPSMDLSDTSLLKKIASDRDFYLGEAVASEIMRRPSASLLELAQLCAAHPHPQVANAGQRAVKAVQSLMQ